MTLVCGGAYSSNHHWHYAVYFLGFRMGGRGGVNQLMEDKLIFVITVIQRTLLLL